MIEDNTDPENRDPASAPPRVGVLSYAPAQGRERGLAATIALAAALLFPVLIPLVCGGVKPSLIGGALLLTLPLAALVLGATASSDRRAGPRTRSAARWAKWIGGVELGLALLALVLLPSMGKPREGAQRIKCASNLRQIYQALALYAQSNGDRCPPSFDEIVNVDVTAQVFVCPSSNDDVATGPTTRAVVQQLNLPGFCSYVYALSGSPQSALVTDAHVVAYEPIGNHSGHRNHPDGINVLYGGGEVQWLPRRDAEYLIAELNAGHNPPRPR